MSLHPRPVRIVAVGDIFPGDHYFSLGHGMLSRTARGIHHNVLAPVANAFAGADIVIGNIEGPLCRSSADPSPVGSAAFRGLPDFLSTLRASGFTHLNVANNHIMQHGRAAFAETIEALRAHGIKAVGLDGKADGCISSPVIESIDGRRVCLVGYSNVPERYAADHGYAHFIDPTAVAREISWLATQFDEVVVSCHAGEEGMTTPSRQLVEMYRCFVDAGARCVLGHHSHVFQPVEIHRAGVIAYSLGNFIFDLFWDPITIESGVLHVSLEHPQPRFEIHPTEFTRDYAVIQLEEPRRGAFLQKLAAEREQLCALSDEEYRMRLADYEQGNQRRKYAYFFANILKGQTLNKVRFLLGKTKRAA